MSQENQAVQELSVDHHAVTLTHLDKVFWPQEGYTKGDVIDYYRAIAPYILPYLKDRPLVLRRHPHGIAEEGFFQKNVSGLHLPNWIKTVKITHEERDVLYLLVQNEATLLYVINLGCIEMNPFNVRIGHFNRPDYMIFDLDPEAVSFDHVVETALIIRDLLEAGGIKSVCKTSGGRGLHIYVPLHAAYAYEQVKQFAQLIALLAHQQLPKVTSLERHPAKRQGKVYIDVGQNNPYQTLAVAYSLRPRPHAPVSTPLKWTEVNLSLNPLNFTIQNTKERLKKVGDLFKPVLGKRVDLKKSLRSLEKSHSLGNGSLGNVF